MKRLVLAIVAVLVVAVAAPASASPARMTPTAVAQAAAAPAYLLGHYPLRLTSPDQSIYAVSSPVPLVDPGPHDASGVRMFVVNGVQHDHPVAQAQYGLWLLDSYRLTGDPAYLDRAVAQAQRIIARRVVSGYAWFFPYDYDFALHQDAAKGLQRAPWFSAMAQGQALSLFVKLLQATGDQSYRAAADATFLSFLARPSATKPWVAHVDAARNLWLDEFPHFPATGSDFTLNGHLFASFGLYDYVVLTGDPRARLLWDGAVHTASVVVPAGIRNPGWISNYCLAHGHPSARYHAVHVEQLLRLHTITGSPVFADLADALSDDYPTPTEAGTLILARGVRTAYAFTARGAIGTAVTRTLATTLQVPFDRRQRMPGRGIFYRVASGTFAGRWVAEQPRVAVARTPVGVEHYLLTRRLVVPAGTVAGLAIDDAGSSSVVRATLPATTRFVVDARSWVRGIVSVHVTTGALAGMWIPATAGSLR